MSGTDDVIKKPNQKCIYTQQDRDNLAKCISDPFFFIYNFCKIQHPTKGVVPFKLYPYQVRMIDAFHKNRFVVALTGRQMGKTACAAAFLLWRAMFVPSSTILIAANNFSQALEIMDRIRFIYENLSDNIRAGVYEYNKGTIRFDNGSKIVSRATTPNAGRGLSVSLLYADEFAFVAPNMARDFWTAMLPTLSTGGSCIITSTPKSDVDTFAQIYKDANNNVDEHGNELPDGLGRNGFFALTIPWDEHPERGEEWEKEMRANLGDRKFDQEMNCCAYDTVVKLKSDDDRVYDQNIGDLFNTLKFCKAA